MSDALTSFYSDLASIDKSTDSKTSLRDVQSSCMSIEDPLPGKQDLKSSKACMRIKMAP